MQIQYFTVYYMEFIILYFKADAYKVNVKKL